MMTDIQHAEKERACFFPIANDRFYIKQTIFQQKKQPNMSPATSLNFFHFFLVFQIDTSTSSIT